MEAAQEENELFSAAAEVNHNETDVETHDSQEADDLLEQEEGVYPSFYTDSLFNREAPSSTVAFAIGGSLLLISAVMWWFRLQKIKQRRNGDLAGRHLVQSMLACALDNDDPTYTIISYAATSFIVLGGFQEDFQTAWLTIVGVYFFTALGDTVRTLLAWSSYECLADPLLKSDIDHSGLLKEIDQEDSGAFEDVEITPTNIYEDMGRDKIVVIMVFVMQVLFMGLVCYDIYSHPTGSCFDGTSGCPVVQTAGSYFLYILAIFLACVYMLGPRTNYGRSEQNPEYWLLLLLAAKGEGYKLSWENPLKAEERDDGTESHTQCRNLKKGDIRMWARFIMSYIVNGVGFHILVHALPIQVAMQSTMMGIVYRAVGMMYLVDLDDTEGFHLTITRDNTVADDTRKKATTADLNHPITGEAEQAITLKKIETDLSDSQTQEIIDKAHADIDYLHKFGPQIKERPHMCRHISSESIMMNIIGYGVVGRGGSSKKKTA